MLDRCQDTSLPMVMVNTQAKDDEIIFIRGRRNMPWTTRVRTAWVDLYIHRLFFFFPTVNTLVLWDQRLVDSMDVQPGIWRNQGWGGPTINDTWISGCARVTAPRVNCTYVHRFAFQCPCSSALWISWLCPLPIGGFLQLSGNMAITIPSIHTYNSCCRN